MEVKEGYKQTDVGVIPEEWDLKALQDVFDLRSGFAFKSEYFSDTGPIVLTPGNFLLEGGLYFEDKNTKRYSGSYPPNMSLAKGDLLIVMTDLTPDCHLLGKPAFVDTEDLILQNQRIGKVIFKDGCVESLFLFYMLLSRPYLSGIKEQATGSTVRHTSNKSIFSIVLPWPNVDEQLVIAKALRDVDALLGTLDRLIAKKRDLKRAATEQLLTGQTRLPGFTGTWEETTLGQIGECIIGLTYKPENVVEHGLLVLRSSNIQNGHLAYDDNVYVNVSVAEHLYTRFGDILVCVRNGSRALIGKCALVDEGAAGLTFGAFMSIYRTKYWRFVLHAFQADSIQRQIRDNIGATINQITNKDMKAFRVALPPEDEQLAIAAALSDMDAEIAALEKRLAKTRALKQAMMQELLTGRIRLVAPEACHA